MSFMGKAGFAVAAMGLAAGSVFGAGSASAAGDMWAGIAVSGQEWAFAVSVDKATEGEARDEALGVCGSAADDCRILMTWANGCGALAESEDGIAGGTGPNRAEAERDAYARLAELTPTAFLANVGSSNLSGAKIVHVACTANAR
ncbi:DUF4189 domain-containing protein [Nocardia sp. NPDC058633]|uniref:DUF4189 domain-containing protein n=1 Tax=Nocardia sp. NPDC058633 TaxID=3346568 RepID=UPI00365219C1